MFATGTTSPYRTAANIRALRAAGCQIIVDAVVWYNDPVFQDGPIAQAVNEVAAAGVLYFGYAGNFGSSNVITSSRSYLM